MSDSKLNNIALLNHFISQETKLTSTEKLVAITLMSHRNNVSMRCCPGLTLLTKETNFTRRTIQRAIQSLVDKKEIVKLKITQGVLYLRSQYYFLYDIATAKRVHKNEDSVFSLHHSAEIDNFEFCLSRNWFDVGVGT